MAGGGHGNFKLNRGPDSIDWARTVKRDYQTTKDILLDESESTERRRDACGQFALESE